MGLSLPLQTTSKYDEDRRLALLRLGANNDNKHMHRRGKGRRSGKGKGKGSRRRTISSPKLTTTKSNYKDTQQPSSRADNPEQNSAHVCVTNQSRCVCVCGGVVGVGGMLKGAVVPFGFWFSLLFWLHCIPQRCIKIYFSFMAPDKGTTLTTAHCTKEFTLYCCV